MLRWKLTYPQHLKPRWNQGFGTDHCFFPFTLGPLHQEFQGFHSDEDVAPSSLRSALRSQRGE